MKVVRQLLSQLYMQLAELAYSVIAEFSGLKCGRTSLYIVVYYDEGYDPFITMIHGHLDPVSDVLKKFI